MVADTEQDGNQGLLLNLAKLVASWDAKQVMTVLGTVSVLVGGYILAGTVAGGRLPYTDGLKAGPEAYATSAAFLLLGLTLILRSASQGYVEKVDKTQGMGVVSWTYPPQRFHLRSLRVPGHRDGEVWLDVCCGKSHAPQKVAVADDGWVGNFYLDLAESKGLTEITFYRADKATSLKLDERVSKANEGRKFRHISERSWPKDGLEEVFTLQVDNA